MPLPIITPRTLITRLAEYINELVVFLSGKVGGTILYGGTGSGENLELHSTSHATKGNINLGDTLYIDEVLKRAGIGLNNPSTILHLKELLNAISLFIESTGAVGVSVQLKNSVSHVDLRITGDGHFKIINFISGNEPFIIFFGAPTNSLVISATGEIGINTATPNAKALLDLSSTTKGLLLPRMTTTQRDAITSPPAGLVIYNTTTNKSQTFNGTTWNDHY